MKLQNLKPYLVYTRLQRHGLIALFSLIVILQSLYFFVEFRPERTNTAEEQQWLSLQAEIDSLKSEKQNSKPQIYPFNPNFITDFKGYRLGMSVAEIDRLLAFRKQNKYVNSAAEFQSVTRVSDSLLAAISPYFKFPDWVKNKRPEFVDYSKQGHRKKEAVIVLDINAASKEDLMKIYGIGPAISERILKQKESLGAFVSMEQMKDVWGLSDEVIASLNKSFRISALPQVKKIAVNAASVKELAQFPYFRYALAREIVAFRSKNGDIRNADDLNKIKDFPVDKTNIIALYLDF